MIILHSHLQPQVKNELFRILHIISLLTGDMNSINWPRSQCVASYIAQLDPAPVASPANQHCFAVLRLWSSDINGCNGEGRRIFVATSEQLRDLPLKHTSVVLIPPHWRWKISWSPSSIPATTKSQCYYMQASNIYINTYVSWTLNNNFTYR